MEFPCETRNGLVIRTHPGEDDFLNYSEEEIISMAIAALEASPTGTDLLNSLFQVPEVESIQPVQQPILPELVNTVPAQIIHQPLFDQDCSSSQHVPNFVPSVEPGPSTAVEESYNKPEQSDEYVQRLLDEQWEALQKEIRELPEKTTFYITVRLNRLTYICELCNRSTQLKECLIEHKVNLHGIYICYICHKYFDNRGDYNVHFQLHSMAKDITCKICDESFKRRYLLIAHLQSHLNPSLYFCKLCETSVNPKYNFLMHEAAHIASKSYCCFICKKTFTSRSSMMLHFLYTEKMLTQSSN